MEHTRTTVEGTFTYEPFQAAFTGTLTTYIAADGVRWRLIKPYIKMVRGQSFVIKKDSVKKSAKFLPILLPIHNREFLCVPNE